MRLLGIDFETTGLDVKKDRIIEVGLVLWDTELKAPLPLIYSVALHDATYPPLPKIITELTGIEADHLSEFGRKPVDVFGHINDICRDYHPSYIVAHNGNRFDRPILLAELDRHSVGATDLRQMPWLDTRTDLPFDRMPESMKLKHLATEFGFINPFAHRAIFDVLTMFKVMEHFGVDAIIASSKSKTIEIWADVQYENRGLASDRGYHWDKARKIWYKAIKEHRLADEQKAANFKVCVV